MRMPRTQGADQRTPTVDDEGMRLGDYVPRMFTFRDAEGTTVRVVERPS